jgi:hypothetical protein
MELAVKELSEFGKAPRKEPKIYPGLRPDFSYLLHGGKVYELRVFGKVDSSQVDFGGRSRVLSDVLAEIGHPPVSDCFGVVAHGSYASPAQLVLKGFDTAIVLKCRIFDTAPVLAGYESKYGYVPSTLARMKGQETIIYMNILSEEGLRKMDRSEGRGKDYDLVELQEGKVFLETGRDVNPAYAYVTSDERGLFLKNGVPMLLEEVPQERAVAMVKKGGLPVGKSSIWLKMRPIKGMPEKRLVDQFK